jgi:hypothetical protein
MFVRMGLVGAALAVLSMGTIASASDSLAVDGTPTDSPQVTSPSSLTEIASNPLLADDQTAPSPRKPLMAGLDAIGVATPMDSVGLNAYGYLELGYLYDFSQPKNVVPARSVPPGTLISFPGGYKNQILLDQLDLTLERVVDASKGKFDVGFRLEGIFGRDAYYTPSNGMDDSDLKNRDGQENHVDLEQAYLTLAIPVGSGLTIKAGKFDTLMGEETINPTTNAFFTHSYSFTYGVPLTQTGILASYNFTDTINATAGFTRGWNQSTSDSNGAIDFLGQVNYTYSDKLSLTGNLSVGPQGVSDNALYWVVPEAIATYKVSDQLTVTGDLLYGYAANTSVWGGLTAYAGYTLTKQLTLNGRAEYYHDGSGFTTGLGGGDLNFWEFTAGVAVTPMPDNLWMQYLVIRPELRWDVADHGVYDPTGAHGHDNEITGAFDVYWQF